MAIEASHRSCPAPLQTISAFALSASKGVCTVDFGSLPQSNDILSDIGGNGCKFLFSYGELPVAGEICADGAPELRLQIDAGAIPYTIESRDGRERLLHVSKALNGLNSTAFRVEPGQYIRVRANAPLEPPVTAAQLLASIVGLLLEVHPVLQCLAEYLPDLAGVIPNWQSASETAPQGNRPGA